MTIKPKIKTLVESSQFESVNLIGKAKITKVRPNFDLKCELAQKRL